MCLNPFPIKSVYRPKCDDVTIEISKCISLHGRPGEMAKRSSKATESCLEKAPCFNLMSDDDFEELQAGNQLQTMQWNTDWS